MKSFSATVFLFACISLQSFAQVSTYSFWNYWGTYNEISGATVLATGSSIDDNSFNAIDIGFPFNYNGTVYTQVSINANGFMALGASVNSSYQALNSGISNNVICAANANLVGNANAILCYGTSGTDGNHVFTVQWKDFKRVNGNGEYYNFQIKLLEAGNEINLVYGSFLPVVTIGVQVGLRGASNADFNNRMTTNNWAATVSGANNTVTCYLTVSSMPVLGQTFCYQPVIAGNPVSPTNPFPTNNASNIASNASLSWVFGASSSTYDLMFGPKGNLTKVLDNQPINQSNGSFTTGPLNPSTTYQWQVIEHNQNGTYNGPVWSFTTTCGNYSLPFTENFDNYYVPAVGCGTIINANNDAVKWESRTGSTYSGTGRLHIGYNPINQPHNDWYITPGIMLTGLQTYEVKFYYKGGSTIYFENLEVKWGNTPTTEGMNSSAIFSDVGFYKPNYTLATAYFTPSISGTYYAGWHCFSPGDQFSVEVDQITINTTSNCASPTNLTASQVTSNSATISWNSAVTNARIAYGPTGYKPGDNNGNVVSLTGSAYTLTSLLPATSYDVYVQQDCGSGIFSAFAGPISFTTSPFALKTLYIKLFIEGLYAGSGIMNKAQGDAGDQFPGNIADLVTIELQNSATGQVVYSLPSLYLSTSGIVNATIPAIYNGLYYICCIHRNSLITCSAYPVSFSGASISYDFSDATSKAYGSNMKDMGGVAVLYSGDINQDQLIDASDMIDLSNDNALFSTGYISTDIDGSGNVDATDMIFADNNNELFISAILPF